MAKGKHATALFEVIHSGRKPPKASLTGGIPTPRWWFKGRTKSETVQPSAVSEPEPPPRIIERIVEKKIYVDRPVPMRIAGEQPVAVDSANGEINFKLSYAGAGAAGFILIIVLAIAYLVGSRTEQSASSENFQRVNPPMAEHDLLAAVTPQPAPFSKPAPSVAEVVPEKIVTIHPAPDPVPAVTPGTTARQVGLNYVIIQSYPDPAVTHRAADFLSKAGVPCTVEQLPGWSWSSVVSTKGFDHIRENPELKDFTDKIESLGETFAGRNQFNRFHPSLKKWQADQQAQ